MDASEIIEALNDIDLLLGDVTESLMEADIDKTELKLILEKFGDVCESIEAAGDELKTIKMASK